jgi:ATP adenylyltransferase
VTSPKGTQRLWAPWRMEYIARAERPGGCLFCRVARSRTGRAQLVLIRRPLALLMLNRFPYSPGHVMVALVRHVGRFEELTPAEHEALMFLTALAELALTAEYHPHGFNVGANVGRVAGAGFPGHLHLHLVPRWNGDTNFMPVIGETRVLPESLERTRSRLSRAIRRIEIARQPARSARGRKK